MDIATLVGLIAAVGLILASIAMGGSFTSFIDIPSVLIVMGGTAAYGLINFPLAKMLGLFAVVKKTILHKEAVPTKEIERLVHLAKVARSEGLLALENFTEEIEDPFLLKGIQLVVDGTEPEALRDVLETDLEQVEARHSLGKNIMDSLGAAAPAFGMIGTLIGLIIMLQDLSDPGSIGRGMATALLTTLYGSMLSNMVFLPLGGKLGARSKMEVTTKQLIIEGVAAIQAGINPRLVEEKLKSFVPPRMRDQIQTAKKAS